MTPTTTCVCTGGTTTDGVSIRACYPRTAAAVRPRSRLTRSSSRTSRTTASASTCRVRAAPRESPFVDRQPIAAKRRASNRFAFRLSRGQGPDRRLAWNRRVGAVSGLTPLAHLLPPHRVVQPLRVDEIVVSTDLRDATALEHVDAVRM